MGRRVAILQVSPELLVCALRLPDGTTITAGAYNFNLDTMDLLVRHPDLVEIADGQPIPRVDAQMQSTGLIAAEDAEFVRWVYAS